MTSVRRILSEAASEILLHLVERRTSHERPLLLTSQYSGGALEYQFQRPEMGAAVRRRINEFCGVIKACRKKTAQIKKRRGICYLAFVFPFKEAG